MISNAKGRNVSPGVYTEEKDVILSVKSLGITSLGLVGETLYGPAFENIEISEWNDFVDYFGGTSNEIFKGTGMPKYELPYIAKSYLTKSKRLNVVRVLGFSGYHAKKCWVVKAQKTINGGTENEQYEYYPLIVIRSKKNMGENNEYGGGVCNPTDSCEDIISNVEISKYEGFVYSPYCKDVEQDSTIIDNKYKLKIDVIYYVDNEEKHDYYNVSLNPSDSDYIYNVISSNPQDDKKSKIYIEAVYENTLNDDDTSIYFEDVDVINTDTYDDYLSQYRCALTPWLVSEATPFKTGTNDDPCINNIGIRRLFRFLTISDGDASNFQVKVSIEKIDPKSGTFDVVVRDFNDTDSNIVVLEKFSKCSLRKGDTSYIGYKIGTSDGLYGNNSKYITVELASEDDLSGSVPCGFLGYPIPKYDNLLAPVIDYVKNYNPNKKDRKQYFGISRIDNDILTFKGRAFYDDYDDKYDEDALLYTKGFHMDSIFENFSDNGSCEKNIYIDGIKTDEYEFDCVSSDKVSTETFAPTFEKDFIDSSIYKNDKLRKFTVCFYGGFDGWDINRKERTNTNEYNVNNYGATDSGYGIFNYASEYKLPTYVNTSDYYAYLAGYKVFSNPQDVDINIFATPGIDWKNNTMLTMDAIDIIEDPEDGRGGDALYIMNSPLMTSSYNSITNAKELAMEFEEKGINSSYACTYAPWILYKDVYRGEYLYLSPTKDVVRNIAETDNTSFPWFAPAGTTRGIVECEKAEFKTTLDDENVLYENRINPIKTFGKDGVIVWGNKTSYDVESPINRINVRRLMIRVKKLITSAAKHLIFEQYDDTLEKQFRGLIEPILSDVKSNRGIFDYRIVTEVTPETRDQHILPAKIMIKPTPALEYISITFVVYPESVAFDGE